MYDDWKMPVLRRQIQELREIQALSRTDPSLALKKLAAMTPPLPPDDIVAKELKEIEDMLMG